MSQILKILDEKLFDRDGNLVHHAFILSGPQEENFDNLYEIFKNKALIDKTEKNLFKRNVNKLLIDDAREIKTEVSLKPTDNLKKIFFIKFSHINREAENALLKTFEEPPRETFFFLFVKNYNTLLPTTISRFNIIETRAEIKEGESKRKKEPTSIGDRLKEIEKLAKSYKDKKIGLNDLDQVLIKTEETLRKELGNKESRERIKKINGLRKMLYGPSPNIKMILEMAVILGDSALQNNEIIYNP